MNIPISPVLPCRGCKTDLKHKHTGGVVGTMRLKYACSGCGAVTEYDEDALLKAMSAVVVPAGSPPLMAVSSGVLEIERTGNGFGSDHRVPADDQAARAAAVAAHAVEFGDLALPDAKGMATTAFGASLGAGKLVDVPVPRATEATPAPEASAATTNGSPGTTLAGVWNAVAFDGKRAGRVKYADVFQIAFVDGIGVCWIMLASPELPKVVASPSLGDALATDWRILGEADELLETKTAKYVYSVDARESWSEPFTSRKKAFHAAIASTDEDTALHGFLIGVQAAGEPAFVCMHRADIQQIEQARAAAPAQNLECDALISDDQQLRAQIALLRSDLEREKALHQEDRISLGDLEKVMVAGGFDAELGIYDADWLRAELRELAALRDRFELIRLELDDARDERDHARRQRDDQSTKLLALIDERRSERVARWWKTYDTVLPGLRVQRDMQEAHRQAKDHADLAHGPLPRSGHAELRHSEAEQADAPKTAGPRFLVDSLVRCVEGTALLPAGHVFKVTRAFYSGAELLVCTRNDAGYEMCFPRRFFVHVETTEVPPGFRDGGDGAFALESNRYTGVAETNASNEARRWHWQRHDGERLVEGGHASTMHEAMRMARGLERVEQLWSAP